MNEVNDYEKRRRFEAWIAAPPFERDLGRWSPTADVAWPGQYRDYEVQLAWVAWHTRARGGESDGA